MDRTHYRFFDWETARGLVREAGLHLVEAACAAAYQAPGSWDRCAVGSIGSRSAAFPGRSARSSCSREEERAVNRFAWNVSVWLSRCRNTARYAVALPFTYRNWWAVPLPKLGKSVVLELRDGTKYLVRAGTTDLAAVNEAAILNPYLRSPQIVLSEDATVIDIGAYIGDFTMQVARRCPRGRILAVEPDSANVRMIETQMALNHVSHVQTVRAAVGGTSRPAGSTGGGADSRVSERDDARSRRGVTLERLMDALWHRLGGSVEARLRRRRVGHPPGRRARPATCQANLHGVPLRAGLDRGEAGGLAAVARLHRVSHGRRLERPALGDIREPAPQA